MASSSKSPVVEDSFSSEAESAHDGLLQHTTTDNDHMSLQHSTDHMPLQHSNDHMFNHMPRRISENSPGNRASSGEGLLQGAGGGVSDIGEVTSLLGALAATLGNDATSGNGGIGVSGGGIGVPGGSGQQEGTNVDVTRDDHNGETNKNVNYVPVEEVEQQNNYICYREGSGDVLGADGIERRGAHEVDDLITRINEDNTGPQVQDGEQEDNVNVDGEQEKEQEGHAHEDVEDGDEKKGEHLGSWWGW